MHLKFTLVSAFLLLSASVSRAQFYTEGCESASVRWSHLNTRHYDLIFPEGLDSLAMVYANTLEWAATAAGYRFPYEPCQLQKGLLPVVLHPFAAYSNGMSCWSPRQMSLYTCPSAYNPVSTPWIKHLVIHESRHVAQSQYVLSTKYRWGEWLTGDLVGGGLQSLYCGPSFFEGDAVWAETALTGSGRGRSADFLEYIRTAWAEGDVRDYWQWRYGSFRKYTPDYYRIGYLTMAGFGTLYDKNFTSLYYQRLLGGRGLFPVNVWGRTVREVSGMKFNQAWKALADSLGAASPVKHRKSGFEQYSSFCAVGTDIYAVRTGINHAAQLVRIRPDGRERILRPFTSSQSSPLKACPDGSIVWSENVAGVLWPEKTASSDIFSYKNGHLRRLTRAGRFFNPTPCGTDLLVSEYATDGTTSLRLLGSGVVFPMPGGVQVVQSAELAGGRIVYSAISDEGFGIYDLTSGKALFGPCDNKIKNLGVSADSCALFVCDLTGRDEVYTIKDDGTVLRITDTPQGVGCPNSVGGELYVTRLSSSSRSIVRMDADTSGLDITPAPVWPALCHGEASFADVDTVRYEVRPYGRFSHAFRPHSWLPVYFDYDNVGSLSFETIYQNVGLGATVFTQNPLGTLYGSAGYHAKPLSGGDWEHSGHIKLTYGGLPVTLEGRLDISGAERTNTYAADTLIADQKYHFLKKEMLAAPSVSASVSAYMPMYFNCAGWLRGLVPELNLTVSGNTLEGYPLNRSSLSVRGYAMRPVAKDAIYPRWGIGGQVGVAARAFTADFFRPSAYTLLYGYFPGFAQNQNFKFYALGCSYLGSMSGFFSDPYIVSRTRGFQSSRQAYSCVYGSFANLRVYLEYGLPCFPINSGILSPFFYMRNIEIIPRLDAVAALGGDRSTELFGSAGLLVNLVLGNFLCIPYDTRVGVTFDLNATTYAPAKDSKYNVEFNFAISL